MRRRAMCRRAATLVAAGCCAPLALAGCAVGSASAARQTPTPTAQLATRPVSVATPAPATMPPSATTPHTSTRPTRTPAHRQDRPVIVIDPGHSRSIQATDPATGLVVSDYENEPEMRDVFAVAVLVRDRLRADGYRVVMTKSRLDQRRSLAQRAEIANRAHAALALSIHDQAGPNGGIGFDDGNNIVYYQRLGTYRQAPDGRKTVFANRRVAALSKRYGKVFAAQRRRAQGVPIRLQGDVGYDLGSRGLAPGDIWTVQLLAHVPWIYNEAGGNSAGRSGLDEHDRRVYAAGLVAAVEHCVPLSP